MWSWIKKWYHRLASPKHYYQIGASWLPWFTAITVLLLGAGAYWIAFRTPPEDYEQGVSYLIMYVHVPAASMSMMAYGMMAVAGLIGLVWKMKMAHIVASSIAPVGAMFTLVALTTGAIWGKPTWGTYWVWDARLTSELVLLFLYLGYMALEAAIEDVRSASRAAAILALVGVVNLPIIHFSVEWWHTLHQPASGGIIDKDNIDPSMRTALLLMMFGFLMFLGTMMIVRIRAMILEREANTAWVRELVLGPAVDSRRSEVAR